MTAYYNEHDRDKAQVLRNLIAEGLITAGDVDERSIEDVRPSDLHGYTQCHWFAGIGVWSRALRLAGWDDDRPVWTASCPCQPFSTAGKREGFADERHLWPALHWLIAECRPVVILGEQIASRDAETWIDLVSTDMEGLAFTFGATAFPAAGVGAPHIRDRSYWCAVSGLADPHRHGYEAWRKTPAPLGYRGSAYAESRASGHNEHGAVNGFWSDADWLPCTDGNWRPVEPASFPLVDGASASMGSLHAYGDAIVEPAARAFIGAVVESLAEWCL